MAGVQARDFDSPDETRNPDKTRVNIVRIDDNTTAARLEFEPGWKWSDCIKPIVNTDSCQVRHVGLLQRGTLHVAHDDGTATDIASGEAYVIEPGHDAWVVGDEQVVAFEFESTAAESYARDV